MRLTSGSILLCVSLSMAAAGPASAQYMKLSSDNPSDPTRMRASGTTVIAVTLDTSHDRDGSLQTCNSHQAAACGAPLSDGPLSLFSFTITLTAVGGTVAWGAFTTAGATTSVPYEDQQGPGSPAPTSTQIEVNFTFPGVGADPPGLYTLGAIPVTVLSGIPRIEIARGGQPVNPSGFGTGFGTECAGTPYRNTYVLADPADLCSTGNWLDADGVGPASGDSPVSLSSISTVSVIAGSTADRPFSASDPDGDPISFSLSGPALLTLTANAQVGTTRTGNLHLAAPAGAEGTYPATLTATANGTTDTRSFSVVVFPGITLAQPSDMTVTEGNMANQGLYASNAFGGPILFSLVSGPSFASVSTQPDETSGNLHLEPGFEDAGTYIATVRASSQAGFSESKSLRITVLDSGGPEPPPVLDPIGTLSLVEGGTLDHDVVARDSSGQPITFSFTGPGFMTLVPAVACGTDQHANLHLAPPLGSAGTYAASVSATAGSQTTTQSFTIEVTTAPGGGSPPQAQPTTFDANVFLTGENRTIRLASRGDWCAEMAPAASTFQVTDFVSASLTAAFGDVRIHASSTQTMKGSGKDGGARLAGFFGKEDLRRLFVALPSGKQTVDVLLSGDLVSGGSFKGTASVAVDKADSRTRANPNPFNPSTTISFEMARPGKVRLRIYDVAGRLVNTIADGVMAAGPQEIRWDGVARDGSRVSSGVYFFVLETSTATVKQSLVIAR